MCIRGEGVCRFLLAGQVKVNKLRSQYLSHMLSLINMKGGNVAFLVVGPQLWFWLKYIDNYYMEYTPLTFVVPTE